MVLLGNFAGARAQNQEFFTNDIIVPADGTLKIVLASTTAALTNAELQFTYDSGTSWQTFPSTVVAGLNAATTVDLPVAKNATFNMRHTNAASRSFQYVQVHLSS